MSKYKEIKGFKVQTLASDTAASVIATGSWASGGAMGTGRAYMGGAGSQTAGLVFGGQTPSVTANTEEYNGTAWSEQNNLNLARSYIAGGGSQTAAICSGGYVAPADKTETEIYNGTSWTEVADINTGRSLYCAQAGSSTANLIFGGYDETAPNIKAITESWNGSSWTEVADLNTARYNGGGTGTQTSAIIAGGATPSTTGVVELWNGSSWTETTDLNTARTAGGASGATNTAVLFAGGDPGAKTNTENWDGTSWTEVADLGTGNSGGSGNSGSTNLATLNFGGTPGYRTQTEVWTTTATPTTLQKINLGQVYYNSGSNAFKVTQLSGPAGTWASGGTLNAARRIATGCGTGNTSNMVTGGSSPPTTKTTLNEQYNGSAWTEVGDLNTGKNNASSAGNSPIATTLNYAGDGPGTYSSTNESWNNTSWTEEADLNVSGNAASGFGVSSTSAGRAGGQSSATPPGGPHFTGTEIWDGSSWTEVNNLNASRRYAGGVGTVTAALFIGGDTDNPSFPGGRITARVESWDGTSWSEIADLNSGRLGGKTAGIQTNTIFFGGSPPITNNTEVWNGSSWTEIGNMVVSRVDHTGGGSSTSAMASGGESPLSPAVTAVAEEWSGAETNATITVS